MVVLPQTNQKTAGKVSLFSSSCYPWAGQDKTCVSNSPESVRTFSSRHCQCQEMHITPQANYKLHDDASLLHRSIDRFRAVTRQSGHPMSSKAGSRHLQRCRRSTLTERGGAPCPPRPHRRSTSVWIMAAWMDVTGQNRCLGQIVLRSKSVWARALGAAVSLCHN